MVIRSTDFSSIVDKDDCGPVEVALNRLINDPRYSSNIINIISLPHSNPPLDNYPPDFPKSLEDMLTHFGVHGFYSHQSESWQLLKAGKNLVITTGAASGKSLCYQLPIIADNLESSRSNAILLFPTKALAQDQISSLKGYCNALEVNYACFSSDFANIYDGDTPPRLRARIRGRTQVLATNPDMLHLGILPHHTQWSLFFRDLKYIVIDEIHLYNGIFGSHVANVIRRLKRVLSFYGSTPQWILTSGTIHNPKEHAEKLCGEIVTLVDKNGSFQGGREIILYNPPVINQKLGLRESNLNEIIHLSKLLMECHSQTIVFTRSRQSVENILITINEHLDKEKRNNISGYRSGYLARDRRLLESGMRSGEKRLIISTNALDVGIDIGSLDSVICDGYPNSMASFWQEIGRAGRRSGRSIAFYVANPEPLDQYLVNNPGYLLNTPNESLNIDNNNPAIFYQHLRCALFELPIKSRELHLASFPEIIHDFLELLLKQGEIYHSNGNYYWIADKYPADSLSLRTIYSDNIRLVTNQDTKKTLLGEVDQYSGYWMIHPDAIYLHQGESYKVETVDNEKHEAYLSPVTNNYLTEPILEMHYEIINIQGCEKSPNHDSSFGEVNIFSQLTGYRVKDRKSKEIVSINNIDMPQKMLTTRAFWFQINNDVYQSLVAKGKIKPPRNYYGTQWREIKKLVKYRDEFTCQLCGKKEKSVPFHIHHIRPYKSYQLSKVANELTNLITLCPSCHKIVEKNSLLKSGLSGLSYTFFKLIPLALMCAPEDLGYFSHAESESTDLISPQIMIYERIPGGVGYSEVIFANRDRLLQQAYDVISRCPCEDGCPGCVGPAGDYGLVSKLESLEILRIITVGE